MGIWDNFETALDAVGGGATGGGYIWDDGTVHSTPEPAKLIKYTFQDGSTWLVDPVTYEKKQMIEGPKASSGGGGTTNYNTIMSGTLGANRYTQGVDTDGSRTGYPGATYQVDNLDGSITIINKGTGAGNDPDGDGYDNSTGLPVGVKSIGGKLYYQGQEVNPDGSPKTPDPTVQKYSTWTGYGPKGQGTYYLDGPGGTAGTYIGPTTAAGSGSSSSGSYSAPSKAATPAEEAALAKIKIAGQMASDAAQRAGRSQELQEQAKLQAERDAAQAALQAQAREDEQAFKSGESALDRALRMQESAASNAQRNEDRRLAAVDTFGKGLTAYDAKAYFDALGEAGYDINNLVKGGANLLTNEALTPSAAALGIIRGSGLPAASGLPPVPGGATASPGVDPGGVTSSVPGPVATSGLPTGDYVTQRYGDIHAQMAAAAEQDAYRLMNQYEMEGKRALGTINIGLDPTFMKSGAGNWNTSGGGGGDGMLTALYRGGTQSFDPNLPGYVPLSTAAQTGGGQRELDMNLGNDQIARPLPVTPQGVMPLARGGVASSGLAVVGDSVSGQRTGHEELLIDPTGDAQVIPLNKQGLMASRGLPHYAAGSQFAWQPSASTTTVRSTRPRTTEAPAAPTQPVATTGLPPAPTQPTGITGVPAPNTGTVPTTPVQPTQPVASAPQQPVASTGLTVTPQPDQSLLDEIAKQRRDTILMGGPGAYDLRFGGMSDLYKRTWAENQAQKYGIPAEEVLFQAQKNRRGLGGVALSGLGTLGY